MSQNQIQLPEPDGHAWERKLSNAKGVYWEDPAIYGVDVTHPEYTWEDIYKATTVRRLIAEAVAAEREACALACESRAPCNGRMDEWDAAAVTCAAAIRSRGDQT